MAKLAEIVAQGGIYVKCNVCGLYGAIAGHHRAAHDVRTHTGISAPDPVGLQLESCEDHAGWPTNTIEEFESIQRDHLNIESPVTRQINNLKKDKEDE